MTDTTPANEPQELSVRVTFDFYPANAATVEDEDGIVNSAVVLRQTAFGMGVPNLLIELVEPDEGDDEHDEHDAVLAVTAGDLNLRDIQDLLELVLLSVKKALENGE